MTTETAMRQAGHTAEYYYVRAVRYILEQYPDEVQNDEVLRQEVIDKNQVLIAGYMTTAASDYAANARFID